MINRWSTRWSKIIDPASFVFLNAFFLFLISGAFPHIVHETVLWPKIVLYVSIVSLVSIVLVGEMINDRKARTPSSPITILLAKTGLSIKVGTEIMERTWVEMTWQELQDLTRDDIYLYFHLSKEQAYIVPKRAFESPEQADEFYEAAVSYRRQALSGNAGIDPGEPAPSPRLQRQIQFTSSQADRVHASHYAKRRRRHLGKDVMVAVMMIGLFGAGLILLYINGSLKAVFARSVLLGILTLAFLIIPSLNLVSLTYFFVHWVGFRIETIKKGNQRSELTTLTIGVTDLKFSFKSGSLSVAWNDVKDVTTDLHLIYFQIENLFFDIPRDAFGSSEDADDFYEMVKTCWESAKAGTPLTELPQSQSWPPAPASKA